LAALAVVLALATSGCAGWGGGGGGSGGANSINVLMVNNPQMVDLQKLTCRQLHQGHRITVNFTVLPENDVRDKISQEFSSQAGQYDIATVSNFEIPIYARSRWIAPARPVLRQGSRLRSGRHPQADGRLTQRRRTERYTGSHFTVSRRS
jgi:sorbitol/mannitol transport system substrate-binding protein